MKIEIFSDTVCPWCRIGKQHLFEAMEQWKAAGHPDEVFSIRWRAFQLDPTIPREGLPFQENMQKKFGDSASLERITGQVCKVGEACGVNFDFNQIDYSPNTVLSHQLITLTEPELQTTVVEAIMKAYFEDGRDIGSLEVLVNIAEECGLDADIIRHRLQNGDGLAEVEEDLEFASRARISGVPFFILNDRYALSGAQPVQAFLQAFAQVKAAE